MLTHVNSLTFVSFKALIKFSGMPHKPKPPTNNVEPFGMSLIASAGSVNICTNFDEADDAVVSVVAYR